MKIRPETRKRIADDIATVISTLVTVEAELSLLRTMLDGEDTMMRRRTLWGVWQRVVRDRRDDDTHPRFTSQTLDSGERFEAHTRILPQAPNGDFDIYPDGANDTHMATMFRNFTSADLIHVAPASVSDAHTKTTCNRDALPTHTPDVNVEGRILDFYQSGDYLNCYGADALIVRDTFGLVRLTVSVQHATVKHPAGASQVAIPMHCKDAWFDVLRANKWNPVIREDDTSASSVNDTLGETPFEAYSE